MVHKQYVVTLAWRARGPDEANVIFPLIRKERPDWQRGYWNLPGGHVESTDKNFEDAAARELLEETGIYIPRYNLNPFADLVGTDWVVHCFEGKISGTQQAKTITDERVMMWSLDRLPARCMYNLRYLIPLALDDRLDKRIAITYQVSNGYPSPHTGGKCEPV